MMKKILALALNDAKQILRDAILILVLAGPVGIFILLRYVIPIADEYLQATYAFDLQPYFGLVLCILSMIPTLLFGFIFGLIILDERDENIIAFIAVTPVRKGGYLAYKLTVSVLLGFISGWVILSQTGLADFSTLDVLALAALIALGAPLGALFLVAFAANKVEGLAFGKIVGLMYIAPFVVYFIPAKWQYLAAALPPFWIAKAFFAAQNATPIFWFHVMVGLLLHLVFIFLLLKKFTNRQN